jgi:hypothetical protein
VSQVENIIERKTRRFERETPTAFRELKASDIEINVNPTYDQQYDEVGERSKRYRSPTVSRSDRRNVRVRLPNTDVTEIQSLETVTDNETGYKSVDADEYYLDKENGILRIDIQEFKKTITGTGYNNLLDDARIRVTYTYGNTTYLEPDVNEAISKLTVYDIVNSDAFGRTLSEDEFFIDPQEFTQRIKQEAEDIIDRYRHGKY